MSDTHDLGLMISSRVPLVVVRSREEQRVLQAVTRLGMRRDLGMYAWTVTDGVRGLGFGEAPRSDEHGRYERPEAVLELIRHHTGKPSVFVLCDFHPYVDDPRIVRRIKDIALSYRELGHTLVFLGHDFDLPAEWQGLAHNLTLRLPDDGQLLAIVREEASAWSRENAGERVRTDRATLDRLVANLRGVTAAEARRLVRGVIADDGAIREDQIAEVNAAKFELLDMDGVLSFEYDTARFSDVAGLERLKEWLAHRQSAFLQPSESPTEPLRGILLLGVQGSGKSLAAKAVAGMWHCPLLRLDMGAIYNRFFGESEKNVREALRLADMMAPCVLWVDEIEKGIGQDGSDGGTSQRVLGTLLTWMAERQSQVFVVATANDISQLPPELIRKGRLDEIFFVDLPKAPIRAEIFRVHLERRGLEPADFDLDRLAAASDGFSGAEIEQLVVSAIYSSDANDRSTDTDAVLREVARTSPLSVVMAERIEALRMWADGRAVPADD